MYLNNNQDFYVNFLNNKIYYVDTRYISPLVNQNKRIIIIIAPKACNNDTIFMDSNSLYNQNACTVNERKKAYL